MEGPEVFETQHFMDTMSDIPKKRGRDDEQELSAGHFSFCEHRNVSLATARPSTLAGADNVTETNPQPPGAHAAPADPPELPWHDNHAAECLPRRAASTASRAAVDFVQRI